MSYSKLNLVNGDTLTDEDIIHIEDGITGIETSGNAMKQSLVTVLADKGVAASTDDSFNDLIYKVSLLNNAPIADYTYDDTALLSIAPGSGNEPASGQIKMVVVNTREVRFRISLNSAGTFNIDWGDGYVKSYTANAADTYIVAFHTYSSSAGTAYGSNRQFIVTVSPTAGKQINGWTHNPQNLQNSSYQTPFKAFAAKDIYFHNLSNMFGYCANLMYVDIIGGGFGDSTYADSCEKMFYGCSALKRVTGQFIMGNISSMSNMFCNCGMLEYINNNDESWNTLNCTIMEYAFSGCRSLSNVPTLNYTSATSALYMCYNCVALEEFPSTTIDCSALQTIESMFDGCSDLVSAPSFTHTETVLNIKHLFYGCSALTSINGDELNFANATDASLLFYNCSAMEEAPRLILTSVIDASYMFYGCTQLYIVPDINLPSAELASGDLLSMFEQCTSLVVMPLVTAPLALNANYMFKNCTSMSNITGMVNYPCVTTAIGMFLGCSSLRRGPSMSMPNATNVQGMFAQCTALETTSELHFAKATVMSGFYSNCAALTNISKITVDTSNCNISGFTGETSPAANCVSVTLPENTVGTFTWNGLLNTDNLMPNLVTVNGYMDLNAPAGTNMNSYYPTSVSGVLSFKNVKSTFTLTDRPNVTGIRFSGMTTSVMNIDVSNNGLDTNGINQMFTDLATPTTKRSINITGNPGMLTCDLSIATAKNWTVISTITNPEPAYITIVNEINDSLDDINGEVI